MNKHKLAQIVVPDLFQVIVCLASSVALLAFIYNQALTNTISRLAGVQPSDLQVSFHQQLENAGHYPLTQNLFIYLFWIAVGCIAYVVYLMIMNGLIGVENEIIIDTQFTHAGNLGGRLIRLITHKLPVVVVLVVWLWAAWQWLIPALLGLYERPLLQGESWVYAVFGILGLALVFYVFWTLAQLATHTD